VVCADQTYVFASFWDRKRTLAALQAAWLKSGSPYAALYLAGAPPDAPSPRAASGAVVPQRSEAVHAAEEEALPAAKAHATEEHPATTDAAAKDDVNGGAATHDEQQPAHLGGLLAAARQASEPLLSPPSPIVSSSASASIPDIMPSAACAAREPAPPPDDGVLLSVARDGAGTEALLECSPGEFFALFLQDGSRFTEAFRCARGESDIQVRALCCTHPRCHVRAWRCLARGTALSALCASLRVWRAAARRCRSGATAATTRAARASSPSARRWTP
jgi:hypothetical protein